MSGEQQKKTPIFSDEFKLKISKFTTNAYSDYEGLVIFSLIVIAILSFLLNYWWHTVGPLGEYAYVKFWTDTYPATPIELSIGYQTMILLDMVTTFAFWAVWGFWAIIVSVIIIKHSNKIKPVNGATDQPKLPVPKPYSGQECMYCSSKKIRKGGKDNPDKLYCKTCRRFF